MAWWSKRAAEGDVIAHAEDAHPPTYATHADFQNHALRYPANGWFEALPGWASPSVGTVDRCLQLTAQELATSPLRYRHGADVGPRQVNWITDPDPAWYPNGIKQALFALVWHIYARGDAFVYVTSRYADGYPLTWTLLDPATMRVEQAGGVRAYTSGDTPVPADDVIQISRNPTGALRGTGALEAYWANVQSAAQAEAYAADVYQSTGVSRVALKSTTRRLSADQAADVQAQWAAAVQRRLGAPAILPPDLELLQAITISPRDMLLLESREWDAKQIAAAFGVPAMLLNVAVTGGLPYQNPAMLVDQWWRTELYPRAVMVAEALSRMLPRGHWVEFDPSQAIRPDLATVADTFLKLLQAGIVTQDEVRAAVLDLPPLATGDQAKALYEEPGAHVGKTNGSGVLT